ncbi:MAG: chromosome segregation protein SMC [Cyclobacteriaceae bacterium]|nr:chromosome segregation protein SMC [Cyclobacteriaceae bacterium]MCK5366992.1 chromosome segregation protein SMC [Cyclobacteriaceae bacterium]
MSEQSGNIQTSTPEPKKTNRVLIYIVAALAVLLVAALVVNFIRENNLRERNAELMVVYSRLDSIGNEMQLKIVEIEQLGGNIDTLTMIKDSLEIEKESLLDARTRSNKQIKTLKARVEGYRELLVMKDVEISELKKVNTELVVENIELKTERKVLNQNLRQAKKTEEKLTEKVQIASRLEAENIVIAALSQKGKAKEDEFRARQIDKLKVEFNIAKNDVAPISGKEILIRIIDDNENVLFDVARGSGTFTLDGKETFYTAKQEILFDNSQQIVSFLYYKGSEYLPGRYVMEVYTDGYMMGRKSFRVK